MQQAQVQPQLPSGTPVPQHPGSHQQQAFFLALPSQLSGPSTAPPSNAGDPVPPSLLPSPSRHPAYLHHSSPPAPVPSHQDDFAPMHPQQPSMAHSQLQALAGPPSMDAPRSMSPFEANFTSVKSPYGIGPPQGGMFGQAHGPQPPSMAKGDAELLAALAPQHREDIRARLAPDFSTNFGPLSGGQLPGVPASGSLSPRSLLHLHHQQLQVQQAMAFQAAQSGKGGAPPPVPGGKGANVGPGTLGNADALKAGGPLDFGMPPAVSRYGTGPPAPSGPGVQRPSSSAGRALAGLANSGLIGMGAGNTLMGSGGAGPSAGSGNGPEEITTVFIVGFPDDMTERELNNMFLFARGFEAATLKVPSTIANSAMAGGPYNVVNLQGPGTSGLDSSGAASNAGQGGFNDNDAFFGGAHSAGAAGMGPKNLKNIIGFAKFRTRADALAARDALNGRKIDAERGCVVKTEMAKKNLHTKQRAPGANAGQGLNPGGSSNAMGQPGATVHHHAYGGPGGDFAPLNTASQGARHSDPSVQNGMSSNLGFASQFQSPPIGGPQGGDFDPWLSQNPLSPHGFSGIAPPHQQGLLHQRLLQEHEGQQSNKASGRDMFKSFAQGSSNTQEDQARLSHPSQTRGEGWPSALGPLDYFPGELENALPEHTRSPSPHKGDRNSFTPFAPNLHGQRAGGAAAGPSGRVNSPPLPSSRPDWSLPGGSQGPTNLPPRLNPVHEHHSRAPARDSQAGFNELRSPLSPNDFSGPPTSSRGFTFGGPNVSSSTQPNTQGDGGPRNRSPQATLDMDSFASLEKTAFQRGYNGGHEHGRLHGTFEGRQLGREKGFEIWDEVGYYEGVAKFWQMALDQASNDPSSNSRKLGRQRLNLNELQRLITAFPQVNRSAEEGAGEGSQQRDSSESQTANEGMSRPDDPLKDPSSMDISTLLEHIRARFKITASLLGIPAKFQQEATSGADSAAKNSPPAQSQAPATAGDPSAGRPHHLPGGQTVDTQQLGF